MVFPWMQQLSRSLSRLETQDIKTQPQFNHWLHLDCQGTNLPRSIQFSMDFPLSFMSFTAGLFLTNRMMFPNYLCGPEDGERILKVTKKSGNRVTTSLLKVLSGHVRNETSWPTPKKIANDRKVIPDPIDDRKFQEWKESGKSGILLGITLNPRKCIGEKVRRIPIIYSPNQ
jgi:hypothetical protein